MKKFFYLAFISIFFTGCLAIKIKSEVPQKTYYDLDIENLENKNCQNLNLMGIGQITSLSFLDNKNILQKKSDGKINAIDNLQWIDNPREMIKNILIKNAYKKCISIESGSMKRMDKIISINLLFLGFLDNEALIEFAYKIEDEKLQTSKMGTIRQTKNEKEISALQQLAKESIESLLTLSLED